MDDLNYSPPGTTPRLRGAQPGNTNALLHGLHSNRFRTAANRALHNASYTAGFDIEIMELRCIIANLDEYIQETSDVHTSLRLATAVISAVSTLSRLLRVQLLLASSNDAPLSIPGPAQPPVLASPAGANLSPIPSASIAEEAATLAQPAQPPVFASPAGANQSPPTTRHCEPHRGEAISAQPPIPSASIAEEAVTLAQPAQPPVFASPAGANLSPIPSASIAEEAATPAQPAQTASRPLTPGGKGTSGLGTIRFHSFFSQNQSTPAKIAPSSLLFPSHSPP